MKTIFISVYVDSFNQPFKNLYLIILEIYVVFLFCIFELLSKTYSGLVLQISTLSCALYQNRIYAY